VSYNPQAGTSSSISSPLTRHISAVEDEDDSADREPNTEPLPSPRANPQTSANPPSAPTAAAAALRRGPPTAFTAAECGPLAFSKSSYSCATHAGDGRATHSARPNSRLLAARARPLRLLPWRGGGFFISTGAGTKAREVRWLTCVAARLAQLDRRLRAGATWSVVTGVDFWSGGCVCALGLQLRRELCCCC